MQITNNKYLKETINLVRTVQVSMIEIGGRLREIKSKELYKGSYTDWREFLEDVDMTEGGATKAMKIHENWVEKHNFTVKELSETKWSSLYAAIPLLEKENPREVFEKTKELRRVDIERQVKGETDENCEHELVTYCTRCNRRVYEA